MLLLLFLAGYGCLAQDAFTRLPDNIHPIHYTLELAIFTENLTTRGEVVIYLEITNPTDNITLHTSEMLSIIQDKVKVSEQQTPGWKDVGVLSQAQEPGPSEQHWIHLEKQLTTGSHIWLAVPFNGKIGNRTGQGLYTADDMNLMAITQFEEKHARHAFPCFDEPHLKATFSLSIGRHKDQVTCSNAAEIAFGQPMSGSNQYVWDHYKPTPVMSTYLLAIMVSPFGYTEAFSNRGIRFRTWFLKESLDWSKKISESGAKVMDYLQ